jgi:hypothetical protein
VAEHCVRVSQIVPPEYRLAALLHDAAEAYVVDLPRPIKNQPELAEYRRIEERVHEAIREAFGIAIPLDDPVIRHADEVLLATEARDLMDGQRAGAWSLRAEPLPTTIQPWDHVRARVVFLGLFRELRGEYPPDRHGVQA